MDLNKIKNYHWHVWGVLAVYGPLGLLPLMTCVLSLSTLLRLQIALQGTCLKWALGFVYFPGLSFSGSGSQVLHKGTNSVGHAFCALPSSEEVRQPGACQAQHSRWLVQLNHLPDPSCSVSWVHSGSTTSGVPCISSGELVSG